MKSTFTKCDISILIGNLLCHFDAAFYGFLVPIISPIFFPQYDQIVQLIIGYSFMATSIITRPVGAFIFGLIAKYYGPVKTMSYSLAGVTFFAVLTGLIPSYDKIGFYAPLALLAVQSIKGIFSAGEAAIVKLYLLENKEDKAAFRASYLYQGSSVMGAIFASGVSAIILGTNVENLWRYCFISGGIVGFIAYALRFFAIENHKHYLLQDYSISIFKSLWRYKKPALSVALTTGFSHMTYAVPCIAMNSLMPLISNVTLEEMLQLNTILLVLDMAMIFLIGPILARFNYMKIIISSAMVITITVPLLLVFLPNSSIGYISFVRIWIVFWGVVFMCPQNLYYKKLFEHSHEKYLLVGMSNAIGAGVIGHTIPALAIWMWYMTNSTLAIAGYVAIFGICILIVSREKWYLLR